MSAKRAKTKDDNEWPNEIVVHFDGSAQPNPGVAAGGWHINDPLTKELLAHGWCFIGESNTNNEAEYEGLIHALQELKDREYKGAVVVKGDSKLVIEQIKGKWKCRSPNLKPLLARATELVNGMTVRFEHILRAQNSHADVLAYKGTVCRNRVAIYENL